MLKGMLFDPFQVEGSTWNEVRKLCKAFNESNFWEDSEAFDELKKMFGHASSDMTIIPPFYCDQGGQLYFGEHFYANTGLTILDSNRVEFGDHVLLGPHVSIYTSNHPIDAGIRNTGLETAHPVKIGNNVWVGGNTVINPGVTIGSNSVIGSGSVVTHDIEDSVIAAGNPCRVIRKITEDDEIKWQKQFEAYQKENMG